MANPDSWGLSWGGGGVAQGIWGVAWGGFGTPGPTPDTEPEYGSPFLTLRSELFRNISRNSRINPFITLYSEIDEDS